MYQKFYKLKDMPFEMGPDPRYLHLTSQHADAFETCLLTIKERRGFTAVYGDIGMGKTTIARMLLGKAKAANFKAAYLTNPSLYSQTRFVKAIMEEFMEDSEVEKIMKEAKVESIRSKADKMSVFQIFMRQQHDADVNLVLIIDEAQELNADLFKVLLVMSNFETNRHKLLQMILIGQNELAPKLQKQANILSRTARYARLRALSYDDFKELVAFRWNAASGAKSSDPFTEEALKAIYVLSGGLPREIIKYCHESLLVAYQGRQKSVTDTHVAEAAKAIQLRENGEL